MAEYFKSLFITSFGSGAVLTTDHGVVKLDLPDMSQSASIINSDDECRSSLISEYAAEQLCRYFRGEIIDFKDIPVDLSGMTIFRRKALDIIRSIPYGSVRSYGQIAAECGSPRSARAVGGAMASNPVPVIIPCHRIVGMNGCLTGFSAPGGETVKRMLLELEGVEFKGLRAIQK